MLRHHIANLNRRVSQYQENDGVNAINDGVKEKGKGVKHLRKTLQRIYSAIVNKPEIKTTEPMEKLDISESTVTRATRVLKELGYIAREGSDKTGRWRIIISQKS